MVGRISRQLAALTRRRAVLLELIEALEAYRVSARPAPPTWHACGSDPAARAIRPGSFRPASPRPPAESGSA